MSDPTRGSAGPTGKMDTREFRRHLDETLRRRDPQALRDYLIASGQWQEGNIPADLERAMWLMIAASPALSDTHAEAERWLVGHGYEQEARAVLGRVAAGRAGGPQVRQGSSPRRGGGPPSGGRSPGAAGAAHRLDGSAGNRVDGQPSSARNGHSQQPDTRPPRDRRGDRGQRGEQ